MSEIDRCRAGTGWAKGTRSGAAAVRHTDQVHAVLLQADLHAGRPRVQGVFHEFLRFASETASS